jgi:hypothetical protein
MTMSQEVFMVGVIRLRNLTVSKVDTDVITHTHTHRPLDHDGLETETL